MERGFGAELAEALGQPRDVGRHPRDVPDLDVVRLERARRVEEQRTDLVGGRAPHVAGVEEPVHEELELEVVEAVLVEDLLHLAQASRLEHVLQVGVPDAEPAEADLARLCAPVGPVEEAPLAACMDFDRPGDRPVQTEQLGSHGRRLTAADTRCGRLRRTVQARRSRGFRSARDARRPAWRSRRPPHPTRE